MIIQISGLNNARSLIESRLKAIITSKLKIMIFSFSFKKVFPISSIPRPKLVIEFMIHFNSEFFF